MTDRDILRKRLRKAMHGSADSAEELHDDRGVSIPPGHVASMGLTLFKARMGVLFHAGEDAPPWGDIPDGGDLGVD